MRIRHDLHPQVLLNGKYQLPPSIFSMPKEEKEVFCMVLKNIKVSDAYASNISRSVSLKDRRLYSLKSHDYHILMQDLLPITLQCCMSKNVTSCIIELSNIMKAICGKVLDVEELEKVQDRAALTLYNLEKIFPPSFFTIMVYLVIHLLHEAVLGGPIFYRWMYPIERFLSKLKSYCRNKRYPERSIAEGYLVEECMTFCSRYLEDVETRLNRPSRNAGLSDHNLAETYLFQSYGEPINKVEIAELDDISWIQAYRYVLFHHDSIEPLRKFHTKYCERMRRTQNCGIVVNSSITSYASARDSNPVEVKQVFYSKDPTDEDWYVVLRNTPRDLFDMGNGSRDDIVERSETLPFPEQNIDENIPSTIESGGMRRGRGRTLLKYLYDLNPVERVKVSRNSHGQPVGSEARLLAGYFGILARNANMLPINYESWHHMPDSNKNQALDNIKEVSSGQKVGCLQLFEITDRKKDGSPITSEAGEIMEKLKEKKAEYEAIASTNSSVNLENIDNRIITEFLGPERYGQIAQMQANMVEQITEVQRKYEELQQKLRAEAAAREAEAAAMAAEQSRVEQKVQ
ncbi:hypothetical protein PVK06_030080 [Gossypium arboreum]|uniref:DUF4218 domain-containing protein n=1 Tax=Gossypium arboreum TaxID=29729 RepID=A0ABR0NMB1_GOSAR|nr:hypothetical protein PVK06_030080 [Gossypium arboreum]